MATKNIKKTNKSKPRTAPAPKILTVLPTKGLFALMVDIALVASMFVALGFVGIVGLDMLMHTFSKVTITVTK